jgi:hypothetical protein
MQTTQEALILKNEDKIHPTAKNYAQIFCLWEPGDKEILFTVTMTAKVRPIV